MGRTRDAPPATHGGREGAIILAALIVGVAVLSGAYLVKGTADRALQRLDALSAAVAETQKAVQNLAQAQAQARAAAPRPSGPDPARRYDISTTDAPALGSADARVELIAFSDFQCPFCARVGPTLRQIRSAYPNDVRIVWKHLPLAMHRKAPAAHAAAEAAHRQGKFWEMHDRIFADQQQLTPEAFEGYARQLDLDVARFRADAGSMPVKQRIDADAREAAGLGVTGTPGFFVNGRFLSGAKPFEEFRKLIDEELARR